MFVGVSGGTGFSLSLPRSLLVLFSTKLPSWRGVVALSVVTLTLPLRKRDSEFGRRDVGVRGPEPAGPFVVDNR